MNIQIGKIRTVLQRIVFHKHFLNPFQITALCQQYTNICFIDSGHAEVGVKLTVFTVEAVQSVSKLFYELIKNLRRKRLNIAFVFHQTVHEQHVLTIFITKSQLRFQ